MEFRTEISKERLGEEEYLNDMKGNLSKQQIELLEGRDIKSDEGMIYGQMYADWKRRAWDVE